MTSHPHPSLQKGISQTFRAQQSSAGVGVSRATARLWNAGFSIKHARDGWASMRPALVTLVYRYYAASQEAGKVYYDACRVSAGLGPLPSTVRVPTPFLDAEHLDRVIDPTGLGAFLHEVKQGAMMMDAYISGRKSLCSAVANLIMSGARDWVEAAAIADPQSQGVRRVTAGTCGYCENLAAMGAKVPAGGWHNDCDCTNEPTFKEDTGPSPSLPSHTIPGSIQIEEKSWNNTVEYIGNSLKSGNLKLTDAKEFLNPDGTVNESKAITHLLAQHEAGEPYSLAESGKPLNKTQSNLLDKFFTKIGGKAKAKKAKAEPVKDLEDIPDIEDDLAPPEPETELEKAHAALDKAEEALETAKENKAKTVWEDPSAHEQAVIDYDKAKADFKTAHEALKAVQAKGEPIEAKPSVGLEHKPLTAAEQKALDAAINDWKTGNSAKRQLIQNQVLQYLTGKQGLPKNVQVIGRAFQENSEAMPKMFRGLSWNLNDPYDAPKWQQMKAILDGGVGTKFDLPPSSFSEAEEWPQKFMDMKTDANSRQMKIIVVEGAKGLNIENLGPKQGELEWLSGGRFEVVGMGKHGNSFNLLVKQVSGLDEPVQLKQPESSAFISAIGEWKGSSVTLSKEITKILQGKMSANAQAQTIVDFIKTNTETAPKLWRGLKFYNSGSPNAQAVAFDEANQVGKIVDIPAASFSATKSVGEKFAGGSGGGMSKFMYELEGGAGVNISKTANIMLHENEWLTGGRFQVVGRTTDGKGIIHIIVKQVMNLSE